MKIKPKSILVDLPIVLMFQDYHEIKQFALTINTIIHGKVKVKTEELGLLGKKYVGLFYLQRNEEYDKLRKSFIDLIEEERINRS